LGAGAGGDVARSDHVVSDRQADRNDMNGLSKIEAERERRGKYTWASFLGTISRSSPTNALPVARIRFSPLAVSGRSVDPVCRPLRDHSVSPWRMMKQRGTMGIGFEESGSLKEEGGEGKRRGRGCGLLLSLLTWAEWSGMDGRCVIC
jgi:hypothetical protein